MERNIPLEANIAKIIDGVKAANQMIYSDPQTAYKILCNVKRRAHEASLILNKAMRNETFTNDKRHIW